MGRVLIIGAGGVGTVVAHKVAQNADIFTDIMIASRTKEKCDKIVEAIGNPNIKTAKVDADNVDELVALFNDFKPEMVIMQKHIVPLWHAHPSSHRYRNEPCNHQRPIESLVVEQRAGRCSTTTSQFVSASFDADIFPEFSARSPPTCLENNHPQRCIQCHQTFGRTTIQRTAQYIPLLYKSVQ